LIQIAKWQATRTMKFDTHQTQIESIQISPYEDGYDSKSNESIQSKSESFMIWFTKLWVDSDKKEVKNRCWQHLNRFRHFVNQFNYESIQENCESIHCESIQENCE